MRSSFGEGLIGIKHVAINAVYKLKNIKIQFLL